MSGIVLMITNIKYSFIFYNQKEKISCVIFAVYKYKTNEMHVYVIKLLRYTVN